MLKLWQKDFICQDPTTAAKKWLNTFYTELQTVGANLGISAAEIAEVGKFALAYSYVLQVANLFKWEEHERTKYKDLLADGAIGSHLGAFPTMPTLPVAPDAVPAGIFKIIGKLVQRIKNHPNYDESIGKNLGIIGPEKTVDLDTIKHLVSVKSVTSDGISLDFIKKDMDGVVVYAGVPYHVPADTATPAADESDTEAEMEWTEIARITQSPFFDNRFNTTNKPETRYYKFRYLKKDMMVGQESDIIRVISNKLKPGADLANKVKWKMSPVRF